jgi:hypothetical protein
VCLQCLQEGRRYRLLALDAELLAKPDGGVCPVEVAQPQVERTFPTSPRFEMEPDEQQIEVRILTCGPDSLDHLTQFAIVEGTAAIRETSWLLPLSRRAPGDKIRPFGTGEERSQCSDTALPG